MNIRRFKPAFGLSTAALAAALFASACSSPPALTPLVIGSGTVLRDVTVVDTRDGSLAAHRNVIIDNGRIQQIAPATRALTVTGSAQSIDASGKFVVPGFLDMHTHATGSAERQSGNFALYVAYGITGIREMAGSAEMITRARQTNIDTASGRLVGPEILAIPGDLILGATVPAQATQEVQRQKGIGADFIKLIAASPPATRAILAEAKNQGLHVAGHLSPGLSAGDSSDAGWHSIEHLGSGMGFLLDCSSNEGAIRQAILNGEGAKPPPFSPAYVNSPMLFRAADVPLYARILDSYNEQKCNALAKQFVKNQTWNVPTLVRVRSIQISDDPRYRSDPNLAYVDRGSVALWQTLGQRFETEFPRTSAATLRQYYVLQQQVVKLLHKNGVKMLTGSDSGGSGIWMIPGTSLHDEFAELAAAGLTPLQVLQMTTLNGAEFMHREAVMGTVAEGKNADLVLLNGNPIETVVNLDRIHGVMLKGKFFSAEALEQLKADAARAASGRTVSAAEDDTHVDFQ